MIRGVCIILLVSLSLYFIIKHHCYWFAQDIARDDKSGAGLKKRKKVNVGLPCPENIEQTFSADST